MAESVTIVYALLGTLSMANICTASSLRIAVQAANVDVSKQSVLRERDRTTQCVAHIRQWLLKDACDRAVESLGLLETVYNKWLALEIAFSGLPLSQEDLVKTMGTTRAFTDSAVRARDTGLFQSATGNYEQPLEIVKSIKLQLDYLTELLQLPNQLVPIIQIDQDPFQSDHKTLQRSRNSSSDGYTSPAIAQGRIDRGHTRNSSIDSTAQSYLSIREIFDVVLVGLAHLAQDRPDVNYVAGRLQLWSSGLFHAPIAIDDVFAFYQSLGRVHPLRAGILDLFTGILVVVESELKDTSAWTPAAADDLDSTLRSRISSILETAELLPTTLEAMARLCVAKYRSQPEEPTVDDSDEISYKKQRRSRSKWTSPGIFRKKRSSKRSTKSSDRPATSSGIPNRNLHTRDEMAGHSSHSGVDDETFHYLSFCVETLFQILPEVTREQRYFCSTQLSRDPVRKTSVGTTTRAQTTGDVRPATIGQQLDKAEELAARHDRVVQVGSKLEPVMRAVRDSIKNNLPPDIVNTRVTELEATKRQNLAHNIHLYSHARSFSQGLSKLISGFVGTGQQADVLL
jgi:hypothetical protein